MDTYDCNKADYHYKVVEQKQEIEHLRESLVSAGETIENLRNKLYQEQNLAISWSNLAERAAKDCITLTRRLLLEPIDSHAPETTEVMARWISKAMEAVNETA